MNNLNQNLLYIHTQGKEGTSDVVGHIDLVEKQQQV